MESLSPAARLIVAVAICIVSIGVFFPSRIYANDIGVMLYVGEIPTTTPTTTPPTAEQPAESEHDYGQLIKLTIYDVKVVPDANSAVIYWKTNYDAAGSVRIGATSDHELASIEETVFTKKHSVTIVGLSRNSKYYYRISSALPLSSQISYASGSFSTLARAANEPPVNVTNFKAVFEDGAVKLIWTIPPNSDIQGVKVLRSPKSYSADPFDGKLIYEGGGNYAFDSEIVTNTLYYYTAYAKDSRGMYSTGAISKVFTAESATATPPISNIKIDRAPHISMSDLVFKYQGKVIYPDENAVSIVKGSEIFVHINAKKIPDNIAMLYVGITSRDGTSSYYAMPRNSDRTEYSTSFFLPQSGEYRLEMWGKAYDGNSYLLGTRKLSVSDSAQQASSAVNLPKISYIVLWILLILGVFVIALSKLRCYRVVRRPLSR